MMMDIKTKETFAPKTWPRYILQEILSRAETNGESIATTASHREAELLRFALYNFRRNEKIGRNLRITIDENRVIVTKPIEQQVEVE